ncbi:hypothetical protein CEXT_25381 [Caerostris extrusa]|uniref:Uncharacterized protein n=1 Tax=Caerostris extrusa TaxID=172846 RepID=A0AAV4YAT9_CAEEX|nr:hypothetical protein CEXT_25381 [Caerostris extrusa]
MVGRMEGTKEGWMGGNGGGKERRKDLWGNGGWKDRMKEGRLKWKRNRDIGWRDGWMDVWMDGKKHHKKQMRDVISYKGKTKDKEISGWKSSGHTEFEVGMKLSSIFLGLTSDNSKGKYPQ